LQIPIFIGALGQCPLHSSRSRAE